MKKRSLLALVLALNLLTSAFAQTSVASQQSAATAPASSPQKPSDQEEVVRITTNLVQVDAVVTNKKTGKQVTDLRLEDFEISEDRRAQKVTNFSYVALQPAANAAAPPISTATTAANSSGKTAVPVPSTRLRPEQVRRTIALVVDDLGLSFESTAYVRGALKKFIDEQMQPGDLVAVLRTSAGMGALQQFTSDKRQLYAAVERVRWYPSGRGGISAFAPINSFDNAAKNNGGNNSNSSDSDVEKNNGAREDVDNFREELFAVGTLGAVNFVLRGLRELPGRKSVVLLSDGIKIFNKSGESDRVLEALRRLTDLANRASVVIYTLDARGLQTLGLTAADDTSGLSSDQLEQSMQDRRNDFFESQNGLNYLAQQTGGFFIHNTNDLGRGIRRVLEDQSGYYLIGYRPDESTFDPATGRRKFHRLSISVKNHPELKVRTRNGFYGVTNEEARPAPRTRGEQLMAALTSPFSSGEMHLRLTSLFGNDPRAGSFMRSLLYVDGRDLSFKDEPDGWHKIVLDVAAYTFGDNGRVIDPLNRTETIRVRGDEYQRLLQTGLVYMLNVPVKKPGAYQLRVAVRDAATEHVGSASQFVEVPNLEKNRLALSGIIVRSGSAADAETATTNHSKSAAPTTTSPAATPSTTAASPNAQTNSAASNTAHKSTSTTEAPATPTVRRFHTGMLLDYGYTVYNAQLDRTTHLQQLQKQVRIFREGQSVFASDPLPVDITDQTDMKRLNVAGRLQLGSALAPGEYILQVVITDLLAKDKYRTVTQYIDFEMVK